MRNIPLVILGSTVLLFAVSGGCDCPEPPSLAMLREARGAQDMPETPPAAVQFVDDFDRGLEQAMRDGKPLLLFFHVRDCVYCSRMLNETLTDPEVVRLSERFVCIRIEADASREVCRKFHVEAFPTVQFISPQGVPLSRLLGKTDAEAFVSQMEAALRGPQNRMVYRGDLILR